MWLWLPLGVFGLLLVVWPWWLRLAFAAAIGALPWAWLPLAMGKGDQAPQWRVVSANVHYCVLLLVTNIVTRPQWRVVSANVHYSNRDPAPLLAWAAASNVDLIVVHELHPAYAQALLAAPAWPHRHLMPRLDASGIGLLSRWPLREVRQADGEGGIPQLRARVMTPQGEAEVIALHPMPPITLQWQRARNRTFAALRPSGKAPALAIGDYNATPWSNASPILVEGGWRWFGGLQPTWPHGAWGIPIDAVWGHGPWEVVGHEVGPSIGSDHRPLRVDLRLAASLAHR